MPIIVIVISVVVGAMLGVAATLFVFGVAGMVVAAIRWLLTPPPPPPPADPCPTCTRLQSLWDSMSKLEQLIAFADFAAASLLCTLTGCPGLNL